MDPKIPWYQSAIIRQQIVQLLIAGTALFGITSHDIDWDQTVGALFAGAGAATAIWTIFTRLFKPAPPVTQAAIDKTVQMEKQRQGGRSLVSFLVAICIACAVVGAVAISAGCTHTRAAYQEADNLGDYAYVLTEHYAAVVKEAADLRESGRLPPDALAAIRKADIAVARIILGDQSTPIPTLGLQDLAAKYQAVRDAPTQADLQRAIDDAVVALAALVRSVRQARGVT